MLQRLPILLTVFIDFFGFGLVFLIFTPLFLDTTQIFSAETTGSVRGLWLGVYLSCYFIAQFFSAPIAGALSDRFGRRSMLIWSTLLALAGYILGAVSVSFGALLFLCFSRIIIGAAGGNFTIAQSAMADLSQPENKSKNFALINMSAGLGYVIGPIFGHVVSQTAWCGNCQLATPFWLAAFLCLFNVLMIQLFYKETLKERRKTPVTLLKGLRELKTGLFYSHLKTLFLALFIFTFGWGFFMEYLPLLMLHGYQLNMNELAWLYTLLGALVALCQGVLIRPLLTRYQPIHLARTGQVLCGVLLGICMLSHTPWLFFIVLLPLLFAEALISPSCSTIVSQSCSKTEQGEMLGISQSVQAAALSISPFFSGSFVAGDPFMPLWFSAICIFIGWIVMSKWQPKIYVPIVVSSEENIEHPESKNFQ